MFSGCPEGAEGRVLGAGLHIVRDARRAAAVAESLRFFAPQLSVGILPEDDCLPFDRTGPSAGVAATRMRLLAALPDVLIATPAAALRRLLSPDTVQMHKRGVRPGSHIRDLPAALACGGYLRVSTVREPGEFALRGGLIDVFSPDSERPVRIDTIGSSVDEIRSFDPDTQICGGLPLGEVTFLPVSEIVLTPENCKRFCARYPHRDALRQAAELGQRRQGMEHALPLFYERTVSVFELKPEAPVTHDDGAAAALREAYADILQAHDRRAATDAAAGSAVAPLSPEVLYLHPETLHLGEAVTAHTLPPGSGVREVGGKPGPGVVGNPPAVAADYARSRIAAGDRVVFACLSEGSRDRLVRLMADEGVVLSLSEGPLAAAVFNPPRGFTLPGLSVIAESDLFGERRSGNRARGAKAAVRDTAVFDILDAGDLAVHAEHGIGRYLGLHTLTAAGSIHECLLLEYAEDAKLYVPAENADLVTRYGSSFDETPLDKLGSAAWQRRKARVKQRIREMADELIRTAAERELRTAEALAVSLHDYDAFCARFPYEETEDQLSAINETIADLASGRPTDRLICGDVGFGKTEVALRAAFVAAACGRQVALIAPTTLLARQHARTFTARFADTGLRVGLLARTVSPKEAKALKVDLEEGRCDIIIGTHALLAKDVRFKHLGLLIVDEEQHFGVAHKEALKALRADLHVLTLTATPIPRTLQAAMGGLRTLSLLTTPPPERLSVYTYVSTFDEDTLAEALRREKARGGQAFFVVPRISDLSEIERFMHERVPELRAAAVHGRSSTADAVMNAFYDGDFDVLLSTAVVESGIDVPSAGTLIIHRAEMFGTAQLHQLRGRIGRARQRGYAYFTYERSRNLSDAARRRLDTVASVNSLGGGFRLAQHDLDARGAGNLLGDEQSGHVREVGFELYRDMLDEAVAELRGRIAGEEVGDKLQPRIDLDVPARLPDDYVSDMHERLRLYRRASGADDEDSVTGLSEEIADRFGPLPVEARNFLAVAQLRALCRSAGVERLEGGDKGITVGFAGNRMRRPEALIARIAAEPTWTKIRPDKRLFFAGDTADAQVRLRAAARIMRELVQMLQ